MSPSNQINLMYLTIEQIELDIKNPRIAQWIAMYGENPTAAQISLALGVGQEDQSGSSTTFSSLKASIRTYGGIIHPIIVNKASTSEYVVIEGNTRVAIYKEFMEIGVPGEWDSIPAIVHDNLSYEEIDSIRLQAHLVGPRAWDPYSKAKYLNYLSTCEYLTKKQIVDFCGGKEWEIDSYIAAYQDMENIYKPLLKSDDEFDHTRFSGFVEMQKPRVIKALVNAGFNKKDFAKWVIDQKIHRNESVRSLPKVLGNSKSRNIFIAGGRRSIEKALLVLQTPDQETALKDSTLEQLANEIINKLNGLSYGEFNELKARKEGDEVQALIEGRNQLNQLVEDILKD